MTGGYTLDPTTINGVAADLDGVQSSLSDQEGTPRVTHDAGASSTEVADGFTGLEAALGGLAVSGWD
jgi:hypothetical protein